MLICPTHRSVFLNAPLLNVVDLVGVVPLLICLIHFDNLLWRVLLECVSLMLLMLLVSFLISFVHVGVLDILYLLDRMDYI